MNQIALVVVVFGKKLEDSLTIKSLLNFDQAIDYLVIVNNGPNIITQDDEVLLAIRNKHKEVVLDNQIQNKPLSWIYNEFLKKYNTGHYIFFDDDTEISKENEDFLFRLNGIDIEVPKIFATQDGEQYYPLVEGEVYKANGVINPCSDLYSIGSGLIVSANVKEIFKNNNLEVFDSRFALYGVDISFFRKINYLKKKNIDLKISSFISINHSLSRTEGSIAEWREIERLYDEVLSIKYYLNYKYLRLFKFISKQCLKGNWCRISLTLNIYRDGYHPRCKVE